MKTGIELIAEERKEQIEKHGYTLIRDAESDYNAHGELAKAAKFCLTLHSDDYPLGWSDGFMRRIYTKRENKIELLKIAGALIAAEIDRLQTIKLTPEQK